MDYLAGQEELDRPAATEVQDAELYAAVATMLGTGSSASIRTPFDVHAVIMNGLPGSALTALLASFRVFPSSGKRIEDALGVSLRTIQRKKGDAANRLSPEQAGRLWHFAEILARATRITGSQEAAEHWLQRPAIGLNRHAPIDLMATPAGANMVENYVGRIEYGVYM